MPSKKNMMKKNLENLHLKERINYGYRKVIIMMLVSGLFSIVVIGMLFANTMHYVQNVTVADRAVKTCRINVNAAARNIREMALENDASSYDGYEQTVERLLAEVDTQLKNLKKSGVVPDADCEEYASALTDWGNIGYSIMKEIKSGDKDKAVDSILNDCTPALNKAVKIATRLDEMTDEVSSQAVRITVIFAVAGIVCIIICLVLAWKLTIKTGKKVLESILVPLREVEAVAQELTDGNLHSTLDYRSDDEIGRLAHNMRKSIRILGSYVDDIGRSMKMFAEGNFDVQPEVEWKGDFVGILNSFMLFEESMAETIKGIQHVSDEVSGAADQVASSSNDLADGATNQAAVVEELTATVAGVSEQVGKNSQSAKQISGRVDELGTAILESNGKMRDMVDSMNEINGASKEIDKIIATINEIASQTNLLALNASIEAARAGEAGKGFAVVASEIQKLAEQSSSSADIINGIIEELANEAEQTVSIVDEVTEIMQNQQEKLASTQEHFRTLGDGIQKSSEETAHIKSSTGICDDARNKVEEVIVSLSSISEENAASTEETTASMTELNQTIEQLVEKAKELNEMADSLAGDLKFFQI